MHPADMIFYWAKAAPERLAIIQSGMAITYRALAEAIEAVAARLDRFDLARGQPVAVTIGDGARLLTVCLALLRRGIPAAPVNQSNLTHLLTNNIIVIIGDAPGSLLPGTRHIRFDSSWLSHEHKTEISSRAAQSSFAESASLVVFTSGTTGAPKKMILPSGVFLERLKQLPFVGEGTSERVLVAPGLNSSFGFVRAAMVMLQGKTACFAYTAESQLRIIEAYNIEVLVASPQQALELLEYIECGAKYRLDTLREVRLAGGYASNDLVRRIQARLCRNVTIKYGATEAGPIAIANYDIIADIPNAVGLPVPGVDIEIVDAFNNVLPAGEEGLVRCRFGLFCQSICRQSAGPKG